MMPGILRRVAFNLVDTYFVGQLGSVQLAALSFTFPVIMVLFSIVQGLGIGATAVISKSIGKNDRSKAWWVAFFQPFTTGSSKDACKVLRYEFT